MSVGRIALAGALAALAAVAGVLLLSPPAPSPEPLPVSQEEVLADAQIERAEAYRARGRWLLLAALSAQAAGLLALALGRPRRLRRALEQLGARPLRGGALAGAGISIGLTLLALPASALARQNALDAGLSTQGWGAWALDVAQGAGLAALAAGAGAALLVGLQRRLPLGWWAPGAAVVVGWAVLLTFVAPVVIAPLFSDFNRLTGPKRELVERLADEAGVEIGSVEVVDASSRSTLLNAYVDGLGTTRRVVVYDNLLAGVDRGALASVVAHELAHVSEDDLRRGLLFVAIVAPFGMLFVRELGDRLARSGGTSPGTPAGLPAYALALGIATFVLQIAGNELSRRVELRADEIAIELTGDPAAAARLQRRLATQNLSDPDPPWIVEKTLRTHPPTVQRIGLARAHAAARGEAAPQAP